MIGNIKTLVHEIFTLRPLCCYAESAVDGTKKIRQPYLFYKYGCLFVVVGQTDVVF